LSKLKKIKNPKATPPSIHFSQLVVKPKLYLQSYTTSSRSAANCLSFTVSGGTDSGLEAHRLDNEAIKSNNTMTKYVYNIHEVVF
jgi:hypothetical protein